MKRYVVRVEETLSRTWVVEAENENKAVERVQNLYDNGDINLDYDDYDEYNIEVLREACDEEVMFYDILEEE